MTAIPHAERSLPTTIAETLANACGAEAAALFARSPRRELGSWSRAAVPDRRATEYDLGSTLVLALYGPQEVPEPATLRLAALTLQTWIENDDLRSNTARLLRQAQATFEVSREICGLRELDQLLLLVAERSRDLLHCELAGFALLDEEGTSITWPAMSGARTDTYLHTVFAPTGGVAGRAISTRAPVIVNDFRIDPSLTPESNPISFAEGLRSVLAVPLDIADRPRGCLMIGYRALHRFSEEELDVLTSFASQAAIAVENAELYDRVRRERARMQSVLESMDEGLLLIDVEGRVAHVNRRAEEIFTLSRRSIVGLALEEAFSALGARSDDPEVLRSEILALATAPGRFPARDVRLSHSPLVELRVTSFHVYDPDGTTLGRGLLCRDVTAERNVERLKSDVIAIVSHEVRSPLASIRGCASALLDTGRRRTKQLQQEYLATIDRESTRLNELVTKWTDVSLLDAGVLNMELCYSDPLVLLERVLARKGTHRTIRLDARGPTGPLRFDHRRVEQVLENLLDNAIKYSAASSEIDVTVTDSVDELVIAIRDRGTGIPRQLQERVFERFYRSDKVRRQANGCGLGLYICRGIIEAHGGRIWLESVPNEGTTVSFALPRCEDPR